MTTRLKLFEPHFAFYESTFLKIWSKGGIF